MIFYDMKFYILIYKYNIKHILRIFDLAIKVIHIQNNIFLWDFFKTQHKKPVSLYIVVNKWLVSIVVVNNYYKNWYHYRIINFYFTK